VRATQRLWFRHALESAAERDLLPKELLADSLYGSDENCETAQEKDVNLVAPVMGRKSEKEIGLGDFVVTDSGKVREWSRRQDSATKQIQ